jgi:hypothetical protein
MSEIFESKWSETKTALTEGLAGNKKKTMDVVLKTQKGICQSLLLLVLQVPVTLLH